jgi:hypothetical protein
MDEITELAYQTKEKIIEYARTKLRKPIVEDLGDYVPFLTYFGETELCERHISGCLDEICSPSLPTQREDTLLGLIEHYRWTGDISSLDLAKKYVNYLFLNYWDKGRLTVPANQYIEHVFREHRTRTTKNEIMKLGLKFVHSLARTRISVPRNGIFIELLVDMYDLTREPKYLEMAESLALAWLRDKTFQRYGLFQNFRLDPFRSKYAVLAKDNTALLNGFIALYDETKKDVYRDAILRWSSSVHEKCFDKTVFGRYYFNQGERKEPKLMYAMAVTDVLCDAFFLLKEKMLLNFARDIAEFWINLQSKIGLFPMEETSRYSHQDYTNDFCISLWKLYELTGENHFREASMKGMKGLFKFHVFNLKVDYQSGETLDANIIPKYVFLMSKPIILLEEKTVYKSKKIFKLLRDR